LLHPIRSILTVIFLLVIAAATVSAQTDSITLIWEPNTEPNLAGYNLYYKKDTSGPPYDGIGLDQGDSPITIYLSDRIDENNHLSDDNNPEFELTGMVDYVTYFMTLTAFNDEGLESGYSNEVSYTHQEPADLDHVEIEGPQTIPENSTAQFTLQAYFNNNTNSQVNATSWEVNCADAGISSDGVLTAGDVAVNTQCAVSATYTSGDITRSDQMDITIEDTTTGTLDHIEIDGPSSVDEGTSATFTCHAYYSNGTDQIIVPDTWAVTTGASFADLTSQGILNAYEVDADETVGIMASHTEGQSTRSDEIQVTIKNMNTPPPPSPSEIIMDNGDPGTSYTGKWEKSKDNSFGRPSVFCHNFLKKYTFETQLEGNYNVSFIWTQKAKAKQVRVKIYDGNTLIDTVYVNQRKNRNRWNLLGTYTFSGLARVKVISRNRYPVVVDGMKFER